MTPTKTFHLGHLISASTGIFVGPGTFSGVHELVEHLAGGSVWTHQLPAAMDGLKPGLLGQHPWLAEIVPPAFPAEGTQQAVEAWLAVQVERYGERHEVTVCEGGWSRDPVADLVDLVGADRVITVVLDEDSVAQA